MHNPILKGLRPRTGLGLMEKVESVRDLSPQDMLALQAKQAQSIMRMTPWTLMINIAVSALVLHVGADSLSRESLLLWGMLNIAASVLTLVHWRFSLRRCVSGACLANYIQAIRVQGVVLGFIWSLPPVLFFHEASGDLRVLIVSLTIGAFSLGSVRLSQVPFAAVSYIATPSLAMIITALRWMEPPVGPVYALMTLLYAMALIMIVVMRYQDALNNSHNIAELQRRKNIIRLLLHDFEQNASDWLWETDAAGRLVYAPDRLLEITGLPREEIIGRPLHEVLGSPASAREWRKLHHRMNAGDTVSGMTLPARLKGKERWFSVMARPLYGPDGVLIGYRGVASDVTAQRLHEERLRKEKEDAERGSRAKSNFLAIISHELRTPLNSMVGFSELLVNEAFGPLDEKYKEFSRHILDGSRQLKTMIDDILDYTRFERNKIQLSEQEVYLREMADMMLRQMRMDERAAGLELKLDAPEEIVVRADLGRLKQVLSNLLVNAIKFTPEGSVTVEIGRTEEGAARVSVVDTGPGISEEDMKTIFEPFCQAGNTLTRRQDGIGLGLSIARSLVRLHGGDLTLSTRPEGGLAASFTLPAERVLDEDDAAAA